MKNYVCKEYESVGDMQLSVIKDLVSLIHTFPTIFFDCQQDLQQTNLFSYYEGDYIAYRDQDDVYVVQQEKSMIVRCMKLEDNE